MWVLLAVAIVVVGFALRLNAMLVVAVAGITAGLIAGMSPVKIIETFGTGFASSRSVTVFIVVLPVIGLLERHGLMQQAGRLMSKMKSMTAGKLLAVYLAVRQITAAVGLSSIGGPAQAVRPLVVPMAEAAARRTHPRYTRKMREKLRSYASSADTIGLFFGEDVFIAIGSILLITGFVDATYNLKLELSKSPCGPFRRPFVPSSSMHLDCGCWIANSPRWLPREATTSTSMRSLSLATP
ncbi:Membrane protein [Cutibacterium acnes JCM 18920]|nr:Membrane protein [Cutibacterium acnes JCM 18920]